MSSLLAYLKVNEVISDGQIRKGFDRLHEVREIDEHDLCLRVPCEEGTDAKTYMRRVSASSCVVSEETTYSLTRQPPRSSLACVVSVGTIHP